MINGQKCHLGLCGEPRGSQSERADAKMLNSPTLQAWFTGSHCLATEISSRRISTSSVSWSVTVAVRKGRRVAALLSPGLCFASHMKKLEVLLWLSHMVQGLGRAIGARLEVSWSSEQEALRETGGLCRERWGWGASGPSVLPLSGILGEKPPPAHLSSPNRLILSGVKLRDFWWLVPGPPGP